MGKLLVEILFALADELSVRLEAHRHRRDAERRRATDAAEREARARLELERINAERLAAWKAALKNDLQAQKHDVRHIPDNPYFG